MEGIFYAFPSQRRHSLQTTRTWEFIGIEEGLVGQERDRMPSQAKYGEDVIVGMLDSGKMFLSTGCAFFFFFLLIASDAFLHLLQISVQLSV